MNTVANQDYIIADIGLANFGRKEIAIAEIEMPGHHVMSIQHKTMLLLQLLQGARQFLPLKVRH